MSGNDDFPELDKSVMDTALDRADGNPQGLGGLVVRKTAKHDQDENIPQPSRERIDQQPEPLAILACLQLLEWGLGLRVRQVGRLIIGPNSALWRPG